MHKEKKEKIRCLLREKKKKKSQYFLSTVLSPHFEDFVKVNQCDHQRTPRGATITDPTEQTVYRSPRAKLRPRRVRVGGGGSPGVAPQPPPALTPLPAGRSASSAAADGREGTVMYPTAKSPSATSLGPNSAQSLPRRGLPGQELGAGADGGGDASARQASPSQRSPSGKGRNWGAASCGARSRG